MESLKQLVSSTQVDWNVLMMKVMLVVWNVTIICSCRKSDEVQIRVNYRLRRNLSDSKKMTK